MLFTVNNVKPLELNQHIRQSMHDKSFEKIACLLTFSIFCRLIITI